MKVGDSALAVKSESSSCLDIYNSLHASIYDSKSINIPKNVTQMNMKLRDRKGVDVYSVSVSFFRLRLANI